MFKLELRNLIDCINLAKQQIIHTELFDVKELRQIIDREFIDIKIIDVLQASSIGILSNGNIIVIVIKYPILNSKCEQILLKGITIQEEKLKLERFMAKCQEEYFTVKNCTTVSFSTICKENKNNLCEKQIFNKQFGQCNHIKEKNDTNRITQ